VQEVYYQKVHLLISALVKIEFLGGKDEKTSVKPAACAAHDYESGAYIGIRS
jgi:hypothetical protein